MAQNASQLGFFSPRDGEDPKANGHKKRLIVVPRRALLDPPWPQGCDLISLDDFFDIVRLSAFIRNGSLIRNDKARFLAAAVELSNKSTWGPRVAIELAALSRGFSDASIDINDIVSRVSELSGSKGQMSELLSLAVQVQRRMVSSGYVDKTEILSIAMRGLSLPTPLRQYSLVQFDKIVEPTRMELACILGLAGRGMPTRFVLPFGSAGGFTPAVRWIADEIERHHHLPNLELHHEVIGEKSPMSGFVQALFTTEIVHPSLVSDMPIEVERYSSAAVEARGIAGVVSRWFRDSDEPPRVAVLLRTLDKSADRIEDELRTQGLDVRRREGRTLLQTSAGRSLFDLFELKRMRVPRDRLLALLSRPGYRSGVSPVEVGRIARALRTVVARSDAEDSTRMEGAYGERLTRYLSGKPPAEGRERAQLALTVIEQHLQDVRAIPWEATLQEYFEIAKRLSEEALIDNEEAGTSAVRETLDGYARTLQGLCRTDAPAPKIELSAFVRVLERALGDIRTRPNTERNAAAVDLLTLPGAFGAGYDYVVIADCIHQKLPSPERQNPLFGDSDKISVNRALGKRLFFVDEADPDDRNAIVPKQAMERLWFVSACAQARKGLYLSASVCDERGRERAVSDYFEAALLALGAEPGDPRAGFVFPKDPHPKEATLSRGRALKAKAHDEDALPGSREDAALIHRTVKMYRERALFFAARPGEDRASPFSFRVSSSTMEEHFGHLVGLNKMRPLTPTRLEALAQCPFKGFSEHFLRVETNPESGQDADARVLGSLAHKVLEEYYKDRKRRSVPLKTYGAEEKKILDAIVDKAAAPLHAGKETGHLAALSANIHWLKMALSRTVGNLSKKPPVPDVIPVRFEGNIGLHKRGEGPPDAEAVPLHVADRTIFIGGEIDRVDASIPDENGRRDTLVVVDYKNSTGQAVRSKVWRKKIMTEHFQLPMYLRLVAHSMKNARGLQLYAYLVSLRDGEPSEVLGASGNLGRRVMDDRREDGLAMSVGRVILPMLEGKIVARPSRTCRYCRLARACKKGDAFAHFEDAA